MTQQQKSVSLQRVNLSSWMFIVFFSCGLEWCIKNYPEANSTIRCGRRKIKTMIWSLLLHPICIYSSSKKSWWELLIHDWDVWADSIHFQVFFQLHKKVQGMCVYTCLLALKNWTFCGEKKQDWRRRFFRIVWKGRLDVILFLSAIHCLNHVRHSSIFKVFYKKKT